MTAMADRSLDAERLFAPAEIVADRRADGSIWLRSTATLQPGARCTGEWLEHWARQTPHRVYLAERWHAEAPWTTLSYSQALRQVRAVASWILANQLSADRPLAVLSDNSIDHALLSPTVAERLVAADPDREERNQAQPSDHVPVVVEIE